mmetsp:Transcript_27303/g.66414  ORF Transcript_27303/g.66414 Transcript_27303/m.66414 type:complete len:221 (-) Transcript_27303:108-770(-)
MSLQEDHREGGECLPEAHLVRDHAPFEPEGHRLRPVARIDPNLRIPPVEQNRGVLRPRHPRHLGGDTVADALAYLGFDVARPQQRALLVVVEPGREDGLQERVYVQHVLVLLPSLGWIPPDDLGDLRHPTDHQRRASLLVFFALLFFLLLLLLLPLHLHGEAEVGLHEAQTEARGDGPLVLAQPCDGNGEARGLRVRVAEPDEMHPPGLRKDPARSEVAP